MVKSFCTVTYISLDLRKSSNLNQIQVLKAGNRTRLQQNKMNHWMSTCIFWDLNTKLSHLSRITELEELVSVLWCYFHWLRLLWMFALFEDKDNMSRVTAHFGDWPGTFLPFNLNFKFHHHIKINNDVRWWSSSSWGSSRKPRCFLWLPLGIRDFSLLRHCRQAQLKKTHQFWRKNPGVAATVPVLCQRSVKEKRKKMKRR